MQVNCLNDKVLRFVGAVTKALADEWPQGPVNASYQIRGYER